MKKIKLISAPHTPFDQQGNVNYEVLGHYGKHLIANGIDGVFALGTTGEGVSCSVTERKQIAQYWHDNFGKDLEIILHIGANALPDVIELAKHAETLSDVSDIAFTAPSYLKPSNPQGLVDFIKKVVKHAPSKTVYYYHTVMINLGFPVETFATLAQQQIPNFAGVKFNSIDLFEFQRVAQNKNIICGFGTDEMFSAGLASGAELFIGSTFNYIPSIYRKIANAYFSGDTEQVNFYMDQVVTMIRILAEFGGIATGKLAMQLHGLDCGDPRLPVSALSAEQKKEILVRLKQTGLF